LPAEKYSSIEQKIDEQKAIEKKDKKNCPSFLMIFKLNGEQRNKNNPTFGGFFWFDF
jgi:hypothetical protein